QQVINDYRAGVASDRQLQQGYDTAMQQFTQAQNEYERSLYQGYQTAQRAGEQPTVPVQERYAPTPMPETGERYVPETTTPPAMTITGGPMPGELTEDLPYAPGIHEITPQIAMPGVPLPYARPPGAPGGTPITPPPGETPSARPGDVS